jgi:hypothetical protein
MAFFQTKNPNLDKFWRAFQCWYINGHLVYFMYGHLIYVMAFGYIFW